ncbi:hypothetical protein ACQ4PT_022614 [Festuca glaucescens]
MATPHHHGGQYGRLFLEETGWYNEMLLSVVLPGHWWRMLPHLVQSWLRNCIGVYLMYFIIGFLWCFVIYHWKQHDYVPKDSIPTMEAMKKQIHVASVSMPFYTVLPTIYEYMIESGWTQCFFHISDVGWAMYLVYLALYLIFVECGMYWMHRELHHIKPLYKHLHAIHHLYNKENTLSPFAGLASHPVDGILLAMPHVVAPFLFPTHFRTNIALLFMEAIWTANIHDCIHGKVWPVMGAGYHTIHHTTYRHNYGHYTIWMDSLFGTLQKPEDIFKED